MNYSAAIEDLRQRARRARSSRFYIAVGLICLISFSVVAVYTSSQLGDFSYRLLGEKMSSTAIRDPGIFLRKSSDLLEKIYPDSLVEMGRGMDGEEVSSKNFTFDERSAYMRELERLVSFYERAQTAYAKQALVQDRQAGWTDAISSMAFTFGAIAISILLFQTGVSFIRYYSQLAELYDSQASALLAANDDPDKFVSIFQILSPSSVTFGKTPLSMYEKAFDVLVAAKDRPAK